jgi:hypothetical protein
VRRDHDERVHIWLAVFGTVSSSDLRGSMGPKVDAACGFTDTSGKPSAIGALEHAEEVVSGAVGTQIAPMPTAPAG